MTTFIFATFAKGSTESVEERIGALERKLTALTKADEKEDIEIKNKFKDIERKFVDLSNADEKKHIENHKQSELIWKKFRELSNVDDETKKQVKVIEKKLAALTKAIEMEDDASNLTSIKSTLTDLVSTVETNAEEIEDLKITLNTTTTLALENQDTCEKVNELSTLMQTNTEDLEDLKTNLNTTTTKIFFEARKTSGGSFYGEITSYDIADINEGAGFDKQTGRFRAPEGGTYGFTFSGVTGSLVSSTTVRVLKDGSWHHYIVDHNSAGTGNNINSSWMLQLSKGEEVHLNVYEGKLYATSNTPVIFTGNLLKLDD